MARQKKLQIVETVRDRSGASAPLYFDPNRLEFYGTVGGDSMRDAKADVVRQWLYKVLEDDLKLDWIPVIRVEANHLNQERPIDYSSRLARLEFGIERFFLAKQEIGRVVKSPWTLTWTPDLYDRPLETEQPADGILRKRVMKDFTELGKDTKFPTLPLRYRKQHYEGFGNNTSPHYDHTLLLLYTEEAWIGFQSFTRAIKSLSNRLDTMLATTEGLARIDEIGAGLTQFSLPEKTEDHCE